MLERTVVWRRVLLRRLVGELVGRAESHHVGVEGSMLTHHVREGLSFVDNLAVKPCVFVTAQVFFSLIGILRVANSVLVGEGFRSLAVVKSLFAFRLLVSCFAIVNVLEFGFADSLVAVHVHKRLLVGTARSQVVFARVHVGVANGVADELSKRFVSCLAWVHLHALNLADLRAISAYRNITGNAYGKFDS